MYCCLITFPQSPHQIHPLSWSVTISSVPSWYQSVSIVIKTKLRGLSLHANYTDRAAAAGRRS